MYDGALLVTSSDPELDAARALVALGVTGKLYRHSGIQLPELAKCTRPAWPSWVLVGAP